MEVSGQIEQVLTRAQVDLARLADEYRREVMVPVCAKLRLTYLAGMGRTLFSTESGEDLGSAEDAAEAGLTALVPIFKVLDKECFGSNDVFGFYVSDITKLDWRVPKRRR